MLFNFIFNYNLYYFIIIGKAREIFKSEELRAYIGICAASTVAIIINTLNASQKLGDCIRDAFFQVISVMSTSGFATLDYDAAWPQFSKTLIVLLTLMGACAGSTAGGLKISRVLIVLKGMLCRIRKILRPHSVNVVRIDGETIPEETVNSTMAYMSVYWFIIVVGSLVLSLDGFDFTTNITAVLTCVNNVGPGLGAVGPAGNFACFSDFNTLLLSFVMLLGRLEIMPVLIFFSPMAWNKR